MIYNLKRFDIPVLSFYFKQEWYGVFPEVIEVLDYDKLPLPLKIAFGSDFQNDINISLKFEHWLENRFLPSHRKFGSRLFELFGFSRTDLKALIDISMGLSFDDCFWIVKENFPRKFEDYSLFNRFYADEDIQALLLKTDVVFRNIKPVRLPYLSPEFTTHGMMPKCWRQTSDGLRLYKGGYPTKDGIGNEPFAEYYAAQLAQFLELPHVKYELDRWRDTLCSVCEPFTSHKVSFIPMADLILNQDEDMEEVLEKTAQFPKKYIMALEDMLFFDMLIGNTDRHFGNFGLLVDSLTDAPISFAPLFDHGFSLLHGVPRSQLKYVIPEEAKGLPATYDSFEVMVQKIIKDRHRKMLKKLKDFYFIPHPQYPAPEYINAISACVLQYCHYSF